MMNEGLDFTQSFPYVSGNNGWIPGCPAKINMVKSVETYHERYTMWWGSTFGSSQQYGNCNRLKQLLTKGPVVSHIYVSNNFGSYRSGIFTDYTCPTDGNINHAIVVTGFIKNYQNSGRDVFVIKNSWGTGWGSGGYMYIDANYNSNPCGICSWFFYYALAQ